MHYIDELQAREVSDGTVVADWSLTDLYFTGKDDAAGSTLKGILRREKRGSEAP